MEPMKFRPSVKAKVPPAVPNLPDWRSWGNQGIHDRQKYSHTTKHGEYHFAPVAGTDGKFVGYHLQFAHTGEGKKTGPGVWTDLGLHTHPGLAIGSARKHHVAFGKNEGAVEEGAVKQKNKAAKKSLETRLGHMASTTPAPFSQDSARKSFRSAEKFGGLRSASDAFARKVHRTRNKNALSWKVTSPEVVKYSFSKAPMRGKGRWSTKAEAVAPGPRGARLNKIRRAAEKIKPEPHSFKLGDFEKGAALKRISAIVAKHANPLTRTTNPTQHAKNTHDSLSTNFRHKVAKALVRKHGDGEIA